MAKKPLPSLLLLNLFNFPGEGANLWKYFRVLHRLSTSHKFVQIGIKGKQVVFRGRGLGAKNTINDVKAMFRAEGQRPDKFLLIVIRDPLVM
jgi:hypothetical protein